MRTTSYRTTNFPPTFFPACEATSASSTVGGSDILPPSASAVSNHPQAQSDSSGIGSSSVHSLGSSLAASRVILVVVRARVRFSELREPDASRIV